MDGFDRTPGERGHAFRFIKSKRGKRMNCRTTAVPDRLREVVFWEGVKAIEVTRLRLNCRRVYMLRLSSAVQGEVIAVE